MSSTDTRVEKGAVADGIPCAFCGEIDRVNDALRRPVSFHGVIRRYTRCGNCGSRSLSPMPGNNELEALYTTDYFEGPGRDELEMEIPNTESWVLDNLPKGDGDLFVDLGCGDGNLLRLVADHGYEVLGLDINEASVTTARITSGCPVLTLDELDSFLGQASIVHLGDVLEHVPNPAEVLRGAITLLEPQGLLLAQGPLEANRSLFNFVLALVALLRKSAPVNDPPYHVHLVSPRGQEFFFQRFGFETLKYRLSDTSWPAPATFDSSLLINPRRFSLYLCRRFSSMIRPLAPRLLSNRFSYLGRYVPPEQRP